MNSTAKIIAMNLAENVDDVFCRMAKASVEEGIIVPSVLQKNLEDAGYSVNYKDGDDHGFWCLVTKDDIDVYDADNPNIVARAFSHSKGDALVQAIFAEMKEEKKRAEAKSN